MVVKCGVGQKAKVNLGCGDDMGKAKMPKTLYGFPVVIKNWVSRDKIYLMPKLKVEVNPIKIVGSKSEKIWFFPYEMKITKELREALKKMVGIK